MAHNVDPAHKYLPGSLSLSKDSLYLNVGQHLKSQGPGQGLLSSRRPATLWYSGSSSRLSKSCTLPRLPVRLFSCWGSGCVINMWLGITAETKTWLSLPHACYRHKCGFLISWLFVMNDLFCFSAPPIITKLHDSAFKEKKKSFSFFFSFFLEDVFLIFVPTPVFLAECSARSSAVTVSSAWWLGALCGVVGGQMGGFKDVRNIYPLTRELFLSLKCNFWLVFRPCMWLCFLLCIFPPTAWPLSLKMSQKCDMIHVTKLPRSASGLCNFQIVDVK